MAPESTSAILTSVMQVTVLVNPKAGLPRDRQRLGERVSGVLPDDQVTVLVPRSEEDLISSARSAAASGVDLVVAAGGDGTVHHIADALTGTGSTLGVLPLGSGNGFARALGIGSTLRGAYQVLRGGRDVSLDVGYVNGEPFFCVSGLGFDAIVGEEFTRSKVRGLLPYLGIAARESLQYRPVEVSLQFDDMEVIAPVFLVTVANTSQFGSGAIIAPEADPTDGILDVVMVRSLNALEVVVNSPRLFDGSIRSIPQVEIYRCRAARITRTNRGPLHVDGEPIEAGAVLDYTLKPGALKVRLPHDFGHHGSSKRGG